MNNLGFGLSNIYGGSIKVQKHHCKTSFMTLCYVLNDSESIGLRIVRRCTYE